jgi:hypothetical protein
MRRTMGVSGSSVTNCGCAFDWLEHDGTPSWHYTRTCSYCKQAFGAVLCEHEAPDHWCPHCGYYAPISKLETPSFEIL